MNKLDDNKLNGVFLAVNLIIFIVLIWAANTGWLTGTTAEQWIAIATVTAAICTTITAVCAVRALRSLSLLKNQISGDHERSRREMGVELMKFWQMFHVNQDLPYMCARRLLGKLSSDQCKRVNKKESFTIGTEHKPLMDIALAFKKSITATLQGQGFTSAPIEPHFTFNEAESTMLRGYGVRYLNNLEVVATAWRHHITDRKIIEEGFEGILDGSDDTFLEHFLYAQEHYKSLKLMMGELKKQKAGNTEVKPRLD